MRGVALLLFLLIGAPAAAQDYDGYFSSLFLAMPDLESSDGRQPSAELRTRLVGEALFDPSDQLHVRIGVYADTVVGRRESAILRPGDLYVEWRRERFDLRAGMSRITWGRLDEFQPTDVINPIDLSRFLLEGRSEARMPAALLRGRLFLPGSSTLEGIVVPVFRGARFDELEEETSPFRLSPEGLRDRREPGIAWKNLQGGARVSSTIGRVDWALSAWRGFESFPTYSLAPIPLDPLALVIPTFIETFPRFTMLGADFETVAGPWGLRGEFAFFEGASPRSFEGGVGADRRAGDYRVALNAVVARRETTQVTLVGWAERSFARATRTTRLLGVYDPADDTAFVRGVGAVSVRDNLWLEASAGWFVGADPAPEAVRAARPAGGADVLALLSRRDFVYARLRVHF